MPVRALKIDLLNICNARCSFCPYHGTKGSVTTQLRHRHEQTSALAVEDIEALAQACDHLRIRPQFKFSGRGEATLHRSFSAILRLLVERGFATRLITNGLRLTQCATLLASCGTSVVVSIHGDAHAHGAVIGTPDALARAEDGIRALLTLNAAVAVAIILTRAVLPSLRILVERYAAQGIPTRVHHNFDLNEQRELAPEHVAAAIAEVRFHHPEVRFVPNLSSEHIARYYGPGAFILAPHACVRHAEELEIDSDGTVRVCNSGPLGNIRQEAFADIVHSAARHAFVNAVDQELASPGGLCTARCDRCCYQTAISA